MALAVAASSRLGFRLKDCRRGSWGFAMRSGRIVPLVLDGNCWQRLAPEDPYGQWPNKRLIGSFWPLLTEVHEQASNDIQPMYVTYLLRRLAGLTHRPGIDFGENILFLQLYGRFLLSFDIAIG